MTYEGLTITEWALKAKQERERVVEYVALVNDLNQRLGKAECNQDLVELYWQREQKAIRERDQAREAIKGILDAFQTLPHQATEKTFHTFAFWFAAHIEQIEEALK
jgi:hypothetical protein